MTSTDIKKNIFRTLSVPFAVTIIFIGLHVFFMDGLINRNDDVAMLGYVSGELFTDFPSEYMVHINVIIGYLLKSLFIEFPAFNWYAIFLQSVVLIGLFFGMVGISRLVIQQKDFLLPGILLSVVFICFSIYFSLHLTYTSVAIFLACGALLFWFCSSHRNLSYPDIIIVSILFGIASLYRVNSILMIVAASAPLIALLILNKNKRSQTLIILSLTTLVALGGVAIHSIYEHSDSEVLEYRNYSNVREKIHGRAVLSWDEEMAEDLKEVGWSKNDLLMFKSWGYADENVFSQEKLEKLLEVRGLARNDLWQSIKDLVKRDWGFIPLFIGTIIIVLISFRSSHVAIVISVLVVWILLLIVSLSLFMRFPTRIAYGLYCVSLINICMAPLLLGVKSSINKSGKVAALAIVLFAGIYSSHQTVNAVKKYIGKGEYPRQFTRLTELDSDGLFVVWGSSMALDQYPSSLSPKSVPHLNIIFLAWPTFSPVHNYMLNKYNIHNLYLHLLDTDGVYLVAQDWRIDILKTFMKEHYGVDIHIISKKGLPKIGTVYQLSGYPKSNSFN